MHSRKAGRVWWERDKTHFGTKCREGFLIIFAAAAAVARKGVMATMPVHRRTHKENDDSSDSEEDVQGNERNRQRKQRGGKSNKGSVKEHDRSRRKSSRDVRRGPTTRGSMRDSQASQTEVEEAVVNGRKRAEEAETLEEYMVEAESIGVVSSVSDVSVAITATIRRCWRLKKFISNDKEIEPGGRIMKWICKEMRIGGSCDQRARWWNQNKHKKLVKEKFNQFRNSATNGLKKRIVGEYAWLEMLKYARFGANSPSTPLLLLSVARVV